LIVGNRNRGPIGDEQANAAQRCQRCQRHDERRQPKAADSEGVENANGEASCERDDDRCPNRKTVCQQQGDNDAGEPDDRADRQINACGNDDERLAQGENCDHRALPQQVGDVVVCPEAGRAERQHNPHEGEQGNECQAEQGTDSRPSFCRG
jgi:hypothetical protein